MDAFEQRAHAALTTALGDAATFRPQQLDAIRAVAEQRKRVLLVQRTGWGKSAVYFVATRLLRDQGLGPTIIISPLLALMRDQMEAAQRLGLRADTINSSNNAEWDRIEAELIDGGIDLLLISPERLNNTEFRARLLKPLAAAAGLLVIDEAHCISDWGHDFRPDYRRLVSVLELMPDGIPVLCTTATANDRVIDDIGAQLGAGLETIRGRLDRESLWLSVRTMPSQAERLAWLLHAVEQSAGSGIVYCLTVTDAQRIADWFVVHGVTAAAYSGETDPEVRIAVERQLKDNEVKVVAATSALGMGFDKPDLTFVIHYQSPDSPIAYYQQIGRAGRSVERADVALLAGHEDEDIWRYFLETSLPIQADAESVVATLADAGDWMSQRDLEPLLNVRSSRLGGLLKVLEVEGAVERNRSRFRRSEDAWQFDTARFERVREARLGEQAAMRAYAELSACRMQYLRRQLDDPQPEPCGQCDNCRGEVDDWEPPREIVQEALEFIRRRPVIVEPRKMWAGGARSGRIAADALLEPGRALAYLSDPGWGREVAAARYDRETISDEAVAAAAALIEEWAPDPAPTALAYVPALDDDRQLVPDFAARLASRLGLPVVQALRKRRPTRPQRSMENSWQQWNNVGDAYEATDDVPSGPVLLVDDVADSRWTLTCVGSVLREAGAGPVHPFVIAKVKG